MFGLVVILLSIVIGLLGYSIMPDSTPDANDGAAQIKNQPPGFSVRFLKVKKNIKIEERGWFDRLLHGQESEYRIRPFTSYRIEEFDIYLKLFGEGDRETKLSLADVVASLHVGRSEKLDSETNYIVDGNTLKYVDLDNNVQSINRNDLIQLVENEHIESRTYLMGTDSSGRDMLSRLMYGTRISLSIGFLAVLISMTLGVTVGSIGGYFGGRIDDVIMWLMSVIWSIPGIMLVIAISLALSSRGILVAFVAVGLTMWVEVARVIRGQMKEVKEKQYVEAARAFGFGNIRIIFFHILPNLLGPLIVIATSNFAAAILLEAGLSFLGLSVQPPTPSWGIMIYEGYRSIGTPNSWHLMVFPGIAICTMVLAFNLLGNGLRDAYDPKSISR